MKKILSGVMMLALLLQLAMPVFAQEAEMDESLSTTEQQEDVFVPDVEDAEPNDEADAPPPKSEADTSEAEMDASEGEDAPPAETEQEEPPLEEPASEAEEVPEAETEAEVISEAEAAEEEAAPQAEETEAQPQALGNENWSTATRLSLNKAASSKTANSSDADWYVFTLGSAGAVSFTFTCDYKSGGGNWTGTLYPGSASGVGSEILLRRTFSPNSTVHNTMTLGLPAGTYYYCINPSYSNVQGLNYTLTVNYAQAADWETELNNDWPSADRVSLNTRMNASTTSGQDVDWFVFTLPAAGPVNLVFGSDFKSGGGNWTVNIYPAKTGGVQNLSLMKRTFSPNTQLYTTMKTGLPAGTYYIKVDPSYSNVENLHYHLTVNHTANAAWEAEFNDDWPSATPVSLGTTVYGSTVSGQDVDWYRFSVSSTTTLKIKFNNDKSASGNWTATIHKATSGGVDKYLQRTSFSAKQKSTSTASVKLKKGTYYLQLNPGYSNVQDLHYNFKLNATIPLKSFKLSKSKLSLVVGKTATLAVKSYSPGDTTSSKKAKWTSSNTAVASVSKGKVKAKGVGTTVITCTVAGVSKSCTVTIKPPTPVSKVSIKPKKVTLAVGQSVALKATVSPSKATNKTVSWKSSKKSVATVSKTGVVKAVKAGKATITVTTKDGKFKAKCKITVK